MVVCSDDAWALMQRSQHEQARLFCAYLGGVHVEHGLDQARDWVSLLLSGIATVGLDSKPQDPASSQHETNGAQPSPTNPSTLCASLALPIHPEAAETPAPPPYRPLPHRPPTPSPPTYPRTQRTAPPLVAISHPPVLGQFHCTVAQKRQEVTWDYVSGVYHTLYELKCYLMTFEPCNSRSRP